jgi:hypothetical protein
MIILILNLGSRSLSEGSFFSRDGTKNMLGKNLLRKKRYCTEKCPFSSGDQTLPGPKSYSEIPFYKKESLPYIGHALPAWRSPLNFYERAENELGNPALFKINLFNFDMLVSSHPETLHSVLLSPGLN